MSRRDGGAHQVFRRILHQRHQQRRAPSGDPRVRFGREGLPAALAGRDGGLRARSAAGDRVQDNHFGRHRRRTADHSAHHPHRSAPGLAGGAQGSRTRHDGTDRLVGRGTADLPATGSAGPVVRQHHRAQRAGQHDRHRIRARHHRFRRQPGARDDGKYLPRPRRGCRHGVAGLCRRAQPRRRLSADQGLGRRGRDAYGTVPTQRHRGAGPRNRRPAGRNHLHQRRTAG